jgi:hypothetical protein
MLIETTDADSRRSKAGNFLLLGSGSADFGIKHGRKWTKSEATHWKLEIRPQTGTKRQGKTLCA